MRSAVVLMLCVTLVFSDGWDNGALRYDEPEMFPDKPCTKSENNNAYKMFKRKHILSKDFDTNSEKAWADYLTAKHLCGDTKTQSFLNKGDINSIIGICNDHGTIKNGNLCISDSKFMVYIVQSWLEKEECKVSLLAKKQYYVIVACDAINNHCLPVHYHGQIKKKPSKPGQKCKP